MCFSAMASFTVAAATGVVGIAALKQARQRHEIPLAVVPILFAGQQTIEGTLWLLLPGDGTHGSNVSALSLAFLIVAEVVWPVLVPFAILLVEPVRRRRLILQLIAALGVILSIDLFLALLTDPPTAVVLGHSIRYPSYVEHLSWQQALYLLCTCVSLLISSHRMIQIIGTVVAVGLAALAYSYYATLVSIWCFFCGRRQHVALPALQADRRHRPVLVRPHGASASSLTSSLRSGQNCRDFSMSKALRQINTADVRHA